MKYKALYLLLFLLIGAIGCSKHTSEAMVYNDQIVGQQERVEVAFGGLVSTLETYVPGRMDSAYTQCEKEVDLASHFADTLRLFAGREPELKEAANVLFSEYKQLLKGELSEAIELSKLPDSLFTKASEEKIGILVTEYDETKTSALNKFQKAQDRFAKKHGFRIETEHP